MSARRLVYLGVLPNLSADTTGELHCEGASLEPNTACPLRRSRSPWSDHRPHERVIVGSHPDRADILLQGDTIYPEHVRFYFPKEGDGLTDMMVIHDDSTQVDGEMMPAHQWISLRGGEEIALGRWRWRYEAVAS